MNKMFVSQKDQVDKAEVVGKLVGFYSPLLHLTYLIVFFTLITYLYAPEKLPHPACFSFLRKESA
jgi:hypothetical protein